MNIVGHAKEIADLVKKYNDQDLYERIVTLREEILLLREENLELKEEVKRRNEEDGVSSRLVRDGNRYFMDDDEEKRAPLLPDLLGCGSQACKPHIEQGPIWELH